MGILTDLVIADVADAEAVLDAPTHTPKWKAIEAKGVETIKLSTLAFILEGKPLDIEPVVEFSKGFTQLASAGDEGPWVFLVPATLTVNLAKVSDANMPKVVDAWHLTEELQLDRWSKSDVSVLLKEMRGLAADSVKAGKPILLWMSL